VISHLVYVDKAIRKDNSHFTVKEKSAQQKAEDVRVAEEEAVEKEKKKAEKDRLKEEKRVLRDEVRKRAAKGRKGRNDVQLEETESEEEEEDDEFVPRRTLEDFLGPVSDQWKTVGQENSDLRELNALRKLQWGLDPSVDRVSTSVSSMFPACSLDVAWMFTGCSLIAH
jgi:hypothetical protein